VDVDFKQCKSNEYIKIRKHSRVPVGNIFFEPRATAKPKSQRTTEGTPSLLIDSINMLSAENGMIFFFKKTKIKIERQH
jgi:hypothetical protein